MLHPRPTAVRPVAGLGLVVAVLAVAGFDLRTAVTSVSAALPQITGGLRAPSLFAGLATTSAPLVFAVAGLAAPRLLARVGIVRGLVLALSTATAGLLGRSFAPDATLFLLLGLPTLAGLGIANVALPAVVKEFLPHRIGLGTAVYTAMLSIGTATAAALTVPVAQAAGTWRVGLGFWAVPGVAGVALGAVLLAGQRTTRRRATPEPSMSAETPVSAERPISARNPLSAQTPMAPGGRMWGATEAPVTIAGVARTRLGWAMAAVLAGQSASSYVMLGFLPSIAADHGFDARTGGLLLSVFSLLGMTASVLPLVLARVRDHRLVIAVLAACWIAGDLLTVLRPGAAWASAVLLGVGSSLFTVGLFLIPLRTRTVSGTTALSGFALSVAYVVTAATVFIASAVRQATGTWNGVLYVMAVSMLAVAAAGLVAGRPGLVEDAVPVRPAKPRRAATSSR